MRGVGLRLRQLRRGEVGLGRGRLAARQFHAQESARLGKPVDHAVADAGAFGERRLRPDQTAFRRLDGALALGGHAQWRGTGEPITPARRVGREHLIGAHHHLEHHAPRRQIVARHPVGEAPRRFGQGRQIEALDDGLQLPRIDRLCIGAALPDHADFLARSDRHQHEIAGLQRLALGCDVIIGGVEGERQEHRHGFDGGMVLRVVFEPEQIGHERPGQRRVKVESIAHTTIVAKTVRISIGA